MVGVCNASAKKQAEQEVKLKTFVIAAHRRRNLDIGAQTSSSTHPHPVSRLATCREMRLAACTEGDAASRKWLKCSAAPSFCLNPASDDPG